MGAKQSTPAATGAYGDHEEDDSKNCQNCIFFGSMVKITKRAASMDLIGSPQPETPMHQRRKRAEVAKQAKMTATQAWSSKYQGLEKEVIPEGESVGDGGLSSKGPEDNIVHDGPVRCFFSSSVPESLASLELDPVGMIYSLLCNCEVFCIVPNSRTICIYLITGRGKVTASKISAHGNIRHRIYVQCPPMS